MVCADIRSCSGGPRISDCEAFFLYRNSFSALCISHIVRVMLSVGETATVLVAAVKGWGHESAGEWILIITMNKERVELHNREKETYLMLNTY